MDQGLFRLHDKGISSFLKGIVLTLFISLIASIVANVPIVSMVGHLVLSILIGIGWKTTIGVPEQFMTGVSFASKNLLRIGIIFLGMKLNLIDVFQAGIDVFLLAIINVAVTLIIVYFLAKYLKVEKNLALLTACGTAICGAAAVVAISSQIRARENDTVLAAAVVCLLGTIFTLIYTVFYSTFSLTPLEFGIFSGATLHEIAHVIAASAPAGSDAVDMAVVVKLTRVALLVPVALIIGFMVNKNKKNEEKSPLPIPWFLIGFLFMCLINTMGLVSRNVSTAFVEVAYLLMGMAMAGMGITINLKSIKQRGKSPIIASVVGSIILSVIGFLVIKML
ncbi:YeiH family protein [Metabacillus sediminilitoris]|uniref:YeiH family putative sulfate export transporter n=1 Tax=Metabacillus sediminilitoris TaxID=2567941 RepID=A0A4S4BWW9_9BACI|nr:YeiH family protein [Metabacillus sediminilitoris]QGQ46014.1 putative sulfate exporter family transporter [Metabacillus sediminilitoris]THF79698.1 YeiH family putative sulfate export transporter [Metabacillus sediminilitoris]